jgi:putative PEP-CTERM system histidine kinase
MSIIGTVGYSGVGFLYLILTTLLIFSWRGTWVGAALIIACAINVAWALAIGTESALGIVPDTIVYSLELLRTGAWLIFLSVLLKRLGVSLPILLLCNSLWVAVLAVGVGAWLLRQFVFFNLAISEFLIPGGFLATLAGLILVEQLFRNSPAATRWGITPLSIGIGGIFAYDLFLYSQGLLFGAIDELTWNSRGMVNLLFVPFIAVAARRNPSWKLEIFVSRQVVFYTTALIAVGTYLVVMSAGGYLLLLYGGDWAGAAQIVFFVGAILVLVVLLFSASLRSRFKVFLNKHFFRNKYDYREEWLRLIATASDLGNRGARHFAVKALAQVVDSPSGMLWIHDDKAKTFVFVGGYQSDKSAPDILESDELISFIRKQGWLVDLIEYAEFPERYGSLDMPTWIVENEDAWLIVPLISNRELIGIVLLDKPPAPPEVNYEDRDLLKTIGHHIAVHLAQERSDNLLAEAQQFQTYNRLTAFLMHDLNNLVAQQSLIVANAERHKRNPEFIDDAMLTIANSVTRMTQVMKQLRTGRTESSRKKTLLKFLVSAAVDRCSGKVPVPKLALDGDDVLVEVDADRLVMVLSHLIGNAQDATGDGGEVRVQTSHDQLTASVAITDTGCGMTAEFVRDRLFRPFDSTKGSQGMGIGAYQAREFARQMQGDLKVVTAPGAGTTVTLTLPVSA